MPDKIDDLMSGFENQSFDLDPALISIELLASSIRNNELLRTILGQQLELKELVKGTPNDIDEIVDEKFSEIMTKINELVEKDFYATIQRATKS